MRNGFGLKLVHRFLNLPFLALQRHTLLGLLRTNACDARATMQELDACHETEEADYDRSEPCPCYYTEVLDFHLVLRNVY
jgi:hypothetical protein